MCRGEWFWRRRTALKQRKSLGLDFKIILIGLLIFLVAMGASYLLMKSLMAPLMPKTEEAARKSVSISGGLVSAGEFTTNINDVSRKSLFESRSILRSK